MFEPYFNYGKSMYQVRNRHLVRERGSLFFAIHIFQLGDLHHSFGAIKSSLDIYKNHSDSKQIYDELQKMFSEL